MRLPKPSVAVAALLLLLPTTLPAEQPDIDLKFVPLFNGKNLAGWVPVNVAPDTFTVRDGVIHSTGVPTGILRSERQYENFVIELEWMHEKPTGNAGLFLWGAPLTAPGTPFSKGIEIQILDDAYVQGEAREKSLYTGQGDVFSIHGASMIPDHPHPAGWERCLPSERRANPAGQWNHYRVEARNGVVKLAVNGKVVSGASMCRPRKGYLCLESEGSPARFRNIRIAELPSTNPGPEECQPLAEDFRSLYTGVDLAGWKATNEHQGHWSAADWNLRCDGKSEGDAKTLWTERSFGDFVMIADWRLVPDPKQPTAPENTRAGLALRGDAAAIVPLGTAPPAKPAGEWNRIEVTVRGGVATFVINGQAVPAVAAALPALAERGAVGLVDGGCPVEFANLFVRELK